MSVQSILLDERTSYFEIQVLKDIYDSDISLYSLAENICLGDGFHTYDLKSVLDDLCEYGLLKIKEKDVHDYYVITHKGVGLLENLNKI